MALGTTNCYKSSSIKCTLILTTSNSIFNDIAITKQGGKKSDFSYFYPSQELNLSFQDLGDLYQVENLKRILRRLIRVEKLWLVDNSLTDLSAIRLPR